MFKAYKDKFKVYWYKLSIRKRDDFTCQLCFKQYKWYETAFPLHHIGLDKTNPAEQNLITLCPKCHCRVHRTGKKQDWQEKLVFINSKFAKKDETKTTKNPQTLTCVQFSL